MKFNCNNQVNIEYLNQEARIRVDMDNTAETYLKRGITKEIFFRFVNQIVEMMDKGIKYDLQAEFDLDKMSVEGDVIFFRTCIGKCKLNIQEIKMYLKNLAYISVFQGNDFLQTLYEYLAFMDSPQVNSIDDIRRQLQIWINGEAVKAISEPISYSPAFKPDVCIRNSEQLYRQETDTSFCNQNICNNMPFEEEEEHGAETGVLSPDFWNDIMQKNAPQEQIGRVRRQTLAASLFYMKTGQKISIDKINFTVGKGNDVDFIINNPSISRLHAKIVCQDNKFYLMDLVSTNGTYVNGRMIEPNLLIEVKSGDLLRFSNEEVKFYAS